jgi:hypothetical protein
MFSSKRSKAQTPKRRVIAPPSEQWQYINFFTKWRSPCIPGIPGIPQFCKNI